jgi:hypothetical protein
MKEALERWLLYRDEVAAVCGVFRPEEGHASTAA